MHKLNLILFVITSAPSEPVFTSDETNGERFGKPSTPACLMVNECGMCIIQAWWNDAANAKRASVACHGSDASF